MGDILEVEQVLPVKLDMAELRNLGLRSQARSGGNSTCFIVCLGKFSNGLSTFNSSFLIGGK